MIILIVSYLLKYTILYILGTVTYFKTDLHGSTVCICFIFISSLLACQYIFYQKLAERKSFAFKSLK